MATTQKLYFGDTLIKRNYRGENEVVSKVGNEFNQYDIDYLIVGGGGASGGDNGGGGGCTIRSDASIDSSWLLMIIGFGIGFIRQRLISNKPRLTREVYRCPDAESGR